MPKGTSHYAEIALDGLEAVTLHYRLYGDSHLPAVLCSHGLTCNGHDFDYLASVLAQDFHIIAPDMPGRGRSSHLKNPSGYSNDAHLRWTLALLDTLAIERVHWVGASMGGIMGMMACALTPKRVRSLMLNDIGAVLASEGLREIVRLTERPLPTGDNVALEAALKERFAPFGMNDEHWQHFFTHRTQADAQGVLRSRHDPGILEPLRAMVVAMDPPQDVDLTPLWQAVRCPVLIFRGAESDLLREETALAMRDTPDKDVTLHQFAGIGHMPALMDAEQIALIHRWLLAREASDKIAA